MMPMNQPPMPPGGMPEEAPAPAPAEAPVPDKAQVEQQIRMLLSQVKKMAEKSGVDFEAIVKEFAGLGGKKKVQIPPAKTVQTPFPR